MLNIEFELSRLAMGIALAWLLAFVSYRLRALTVSGAAGAFIVGTIVFGFGGWLYTIPLLFFFISSNFLSKLKNDIKLYSQKAIEKSGARDIWQVFANGGVATIVAVIALLSENPRWFYIYLASFSAATADTWATEIGTLISGKPRSIISLKPVRPGGSGGVSISGTAASLLGSALTVVSVLPIIYYIIDPWLLLLSILAGFAGSLIDSILGASVQANYKCETCGTTIETKLHCGKPTVLTRGFSFINNDAVNFLSNLIAVVLLSLFIL